MSRMRLGLLGGLAVAFTVTGATSIAGARQATDLDSTAASVVAPALAAPETTAPATPTPPSAPPQPRLTLRLVTFNVLGSLHTEPGGDQDYLLPADLRAQLGSDFLRRQKPDVVGFQELRPNQIAAFQREFPTFAFWPNNAVGSLGRPFSLMWDNARFSMVSGSYVTIPYMGETRRAPYVLLQDRTTGRRFYYVNVHNSPGTRQAERDKDLALEIAQVRTLRASGLPVFLGGDFNEKATAFCKILSGTDLSPSSPGGYTGGVCTSPSRPRLDQIFGSAVFSQYAMIQSPLVQRATDHWIIAATATLN